MNGGMIETLIGGEPTGKKGSGPNSLLAGLEQFRCGCRAGEGTSPASSARHLDVKPGSPSCVI